MKVIRVWFELHRLIDGQDKYKVVWDQSPGDVLTRVGDKRTYSGKAQAEEDFGEFWIVGKVYLELKDSFGNNNKISEGSYRELTSPPKEIRLWTIGDEKSVRIALLVASFPMSIIASCLMITSALMAIAGYRRDWQFCLVGAIFAMLAVGFYASGVYALIDLTGYSSWFSWSSMFPLAVAASFLTVLPAVLVFLGRAPSLPKTDDKKIVKNPAGTPKQKSGGKNVIKEASPTKKGQIPPKSIPAKGPVKNPAGTVPGKVGNVEKEEE
jgi:hypothetical protein